MENITSSTDTSDISLSEDHVKTETGSTLTNPFRNALQKFSTKNKKEKTTFGTAATSGFFSKGQSKQQQPVPGSVKQVYAGQFPPMWTTGLPSAPIDSSASDHMKSPPISPSKEFEMKVNIQIPSTTSTHSTVQDTSSISNSMHSSNSITQENIHVESVPKIPMSTPSKANTVSRNNSSHRHERFQAILAHEIVDIVKLRELSWAGIPNIHRPTVWKLLLGYMPLKEDRRESMLQRKRQEYQELLQQYYYIPDTDRGPKEQTTLRQILVDIPRTNADIPLFRQERIHQCMERILYIWALRHPASGYVQGINDLLTPFLVVFLSSYIDIPQTCNLSEVSDADLQLVEADAYCCLTKLLDGIQDHYTFSQPGLQRMVQRMEELVHRCDAELYRHLVETEGVQFVQFAYRWMNCLLMREIQLDGVIRLWDTYLCEENGFEKFHVYVCAAILMTFGSQLKEMEFQELVLFLQNLPTKDWHEDEIDPLLSRAFILFTCFADSPSHLS